MKRSAQKKAIAFIVDSGTYPYEILCFFGEDKAALIEMLKGDITESEIKELREYKLKRGMACMFENATSLLWLPEKPKTLEHMSYLNHEIWHITDEILRRIGIKLVNESTEAYAYLIQYLSVKIWEKLNISFTS